MSNPHIAEKGKQSLIHTNMFWNRSTPIQNSGSALAGYDVSWDVADIVCSTLEERGSENGGVVCGWLFVSFRCYFVYLYLTPKALHEESCVSLPRTTISSGKKYSNMYNL